MYYYLVIEITHRRHNKHLRKEYLTSCLLPFPILSTTLIPSIWSFLLTFSNFRRFSGHLPNESITQNKWSSRWVTVYRSSSKNLSLQQPINGKSVHHRFYGTPTTQNGTNNEDKTVATKTTTTTTPNAASTVARKGKFSKLKRMQKSWGWKAGVGWTILSVLDWWLLAAGGWLTWRSLLLKWTPIGVGLATFIHWHLHNQKCDRLGQPRTASKVMVRIWISNSFPRSSHVFIHLIWMILLADWNVLFSTVTLNQPNMGLACRL